MLGRSIREKLKTGRPVLSMGITFHSPLVAELLGLTGFDALWLDAEHGMIDESHCEDMIRAAFLSDKPALVRVPNGDSDTILSYLDAGASGVIVPHVNTAEEARAAVAAAKYAPEGNRSFGPLRFFSRRPGQTIDDYVREANESTVVICMFEDVAALDELDEIVSTPGLDAYIIGAFDLSFSMGLAGQFDDPRVREVIDRVIAACRSAGIATGLPAGGADQARAHIDRGAQFVSFNAAGSLILDAANRLLGDIRA